MKNQIHINRDYGWFYGHFEANQNHRHFAIQLSIPLASSISVFTKDGEITTPLPVLIPSNVEHRIVIDGPHYLLLLNPLSSLGHHWNSMPKGGIPTLTEAPILALQNKLQSNLGESLALAEIAELMEAMNCLCESSLHKGDPRISKAIDYLNQHYERVIGVDEIAEYVHLSSSRFLHLFRSETGLTFRRAQIWNKLRPALLKMGKQSLSETAHEFGFADSAHFSRIFKENFGFSPRDIANNSQFIQV